MGENLIFLISQPRAGSTLTQKILGSHSMIHTQSEPWVMLHPLHSLKPDGLVAEYDAQLAAKGLQDFIQALPGGQEQYGQRLSEMYAGFYTDIAKAAGKRYFLDKTPRYYLIIPELIQCFPDAKFIILWRNPLAVLGSIINTWTKQDWYRLSEFKYDLLRAPELMLQGKELLGDRAFHIQYEHMLTNPEVTFQDTCRFLEIPFEPSMIDYGNYGHNTWLYGDKGTVNEKSRPDQYHAGLWQTTLNDPQYWRLMHEYLAALGGGMLGNMGYSYNEMEQTLLENKPNVDIEKSSVSLQQLTDNIVRTMLEYKRALELMRQRDTLIKQKDQLIQQKNEEIKSKSDELRQKNEEINEKNNRLRYKRRVIVMKSKELLTVEQEISRIEKSLFYKIWVLASRIIQRKKN
ncbi:MAG TPA: sulfotransferase [Bacteroidales bacterium]|nr:sulfotransferase [Bacteroidales bacterium]HRZ48687.1 sulfotransferase [Bacteroidales bacterium]